MCFSRRFAFDNHILVEWKDLIIIRSLLRRRSKQLTKCHYPIVTDRPAARDVQPNNSKILKIKN